MLLHTLHKIGLTNSNNIKNNFFLNFFIVFYLTKTNNILISSCKKKSLFKLIFSTNKLSYTLRYQIRTQFSIQKIKQTNKKKQTKILRL